jgi:hypothetical protein
MEVKEGQSGIRHLLRELWRLSLSEHTCPVGSLIPQGRKKVSPIMETRLERRPLPPRIEASTHSAAALGL